MRAATLTLISLIVLFCGTIQAAEKPGVWIASGEVGGTYRGVYAKNFERQLRSYNVFHRTTRGSGENLELLVSGKADVAFAQADIYAAQLQQDPKRLEDVILIGRIATECVYIAYRKGGAVESLAQLGQPVAGRPAKIAVGPAPGGANGTWSHFATLDAGLANADVDHGGGTLALNQLAAGVYDAVIWVTDPNNLRHKLLQAVRDNPELALMPVDDPKLVETLPSGTRIYERRKVVLEDGWRADKLDTVCTGALVLARKSSDPALIQKLADIVSQYPR
jgi:TRAP-type uncharacterized transport system substrate-binding protein